MSIKISGLTKIYGQQRALDQVTFSVRESEIVGFLGPNGAGKSTTMKIATCYLPPSAGTVAVGGWDVMEHPMEARRITGYLPEHNPLYLDLYVHEYLQFVGSVYGLRGKQLKDRISNMVELCGLGREQNKRIESLSKGFRQRVGLAQALIHDPKVLILDEPTSGLDPNQLLEIRRLIKDISRDKTVLFSTHIMQEVQALCDRVVVINLGKIVADDRVENLLKASTATRILRVEFEGAIDAGVLRSIPGVLDVVVLTPTTFRLTTSPESDVRADVFRFAAEKNLSLIGLRQEDNSLESIFHQLTIANTSSE
jgi:ABC-2 type transport system ATP-binding protein